jgi:hypothetical protein
VDVFYNNRFREVSDNGMNKAQLAESTVFYLQTRLNEMNADAVKMTELASERELTQKEKMIIETLLEECENYRRIIGFTEGELSHYDIASGVYNEE